jgi:large subunit ribosomal protein L16
MLEPSKFKHKKAFKGRNVGISRSNTLPSFGMYALKTLENVRITAVQIEAARRVISRALKRSGNIWILVFPSIPVTAKPTDSRMGKGKGSLSHWICRAKAGKILFEVDGVSEDLARLALEKASYKIPVKCKFVSSVIGGMR